MGDPKHLSDEELLAALRQAVRQERESLKDVLVFIAEVDRRKLAIKLGFHSLFDFCTRELRYAEGAAYRRITAARLSTRFQALLSYVNDGTVSLAGISILSPHLNDANHIELLDRAAGKTTREIELLAAESAPKPDTRDFIRAISLGRVEPAAEVSPQEPTAAPTASQSQERTPGTSPASSAPRDQTTPLSPHRYYFSFTASLCLKARIDRARDILRHKFPFARLEDIISEMAEFYLERRDPERAFARRTDDENPLDSAPSRRIPASIKAQVWRRDGGRCAYVAPMGLRCESRAWLEYDHIKPWALGGKTEVDNLRLLCRAHNQ